MKRKTQFAFISDSVRIDWVFKEAVLMFHSILGESSKLCYLDHVYQWFSHLNLHQNHLERLLKH